MIPMFEYSARFIRKIIILPFQGLLFILFFSNLLNANPSPTVVPAYYSIDELKHSAERYLFSLHQQSGGKLEISFSELDSRLKLQRCDHDLLPETVNPQSNHLGRVSIQIRCTAPKPWKIYLNAQVDLWRPVVVFRRSLTKGSSVQTSDLRLERHNLNRLRNGYFTSIESVSNLTLNHSVRPGQIVTASSVSAPKLVKRGELVRVINQRQGIRIESKGYAQRDGALGDRVPIKHMPSGKIINAQVTHRGIATISPNNR